MYFRSSFWLFDYQFIFIIFLIDPKNLLTLVIITSIYNLFFNYNTSISASYKI
jgi:hypothetical protein